MTTGKIVVATILTGIIGIGATIFRQHWLGENGSFRLRLPLSRDRGTDHIDKLPDFRLPDIHGREIASSSWTGKVLVLNYWATWCPPCVRELPLLDELQQNSPEESLQVVGIAIDSKEEVERFLADHPVSFPILLGDIGAIDMSRRLGNRLQGLPYTLIFDRLCCRRPATPKQRQTSLARTGFPGNQISYRINSRAIARPARAATGNAEAPAGGLPQGSLDSPDPPVLRRRTPPPQNGIYSSRQRT
jgi:thiol-disulfide isomerase/thioredoxin